MSDANVRIINEISEILRKYFLRDANFHYFMHKAPRIARG